MADWMDRQRQTRNAEALADIVEKYDVRLEGMTP